MRRINLIVVHCSDSDRDAHDNVETIKKWHMQRGWSDIGYHFVITKDGSVRTGRPIHIPGAHANPLNKRSIGICLTGRHDFTLDQFASLILLCDDLMNNFGLSREDIVPHYRINPQKTCPNFDLDKALGG